MRPPCFGLLGLFAASTRAYLDVGGCSCALSWMIVQELDTSLGLSQDRAALRRWIFVDPLALDRRALLATEEKIEQVERARARKWTGRSRGTVLGYKIFAWLLRHIGLWAAYALLLFVTGYYMLFAPKTLRASRDYLRRRFGEMSWWHLFRRSYKHILCFGQSIVDRFAALVGKSHVFATEHYGVPVLEKMMSQKEGAILLSAHLGNWELAGRLLAKNEKYKKKIFVVMLQAEAEHIKRFMDSFSSQPIFEVIPIQEGMKAIMKIVSVLEQGHVVCIHGDRSLEGGRTERGMLLGAPAQFPILPYHLSHSLGVPVYRVYGLKKGWWEYHFYAKDGFVCTREKGESKAEASRRWLQSYLDDLEEFLQKYPYQWFNFFPFWEAEDAEEESEEKTR